MKPPPSPISTPNVERPTMSQCRSSSVDARNEPTTAFTPTVVNASHNGVLVARSGRKSMVGSTATPRAADSEYIGPEDESPMAVRYLSRHAP